MTLTISRADLDEIAAQAAAAPDVEICGLLIGMGAAVEAVRPCRNVAVDPRGGFEIDPAAVIAAHRAARGGGPGIIGHYHSHPRGSAVPSACDAAAAEPGAYWIIVAGGTARCWHAVPGGEVEGMFTPIAFRYDDFRGPAPLA